MGVSYTNARAETVRVLMVYLKRLFMQIFRMSIRGFSVTLLCAPLLWSTFLSTSVAADEPTTGSLALINLKSTSEADAYARLLIEQYDLAEPKVPGVDPKTRSPLLLIHLGKDVPSSLKWVMTHLERAEIPFSVDLVTEAELQESLDFSRQDGLDLVSKVAEVNEQPLASARVDSLWKRSKLMLKELFGLPNGMTLWVKLDRTSAERKMEARASLAQVLTGTGCIWLTTFYKHPEVALSPRMTEMLIAFSAWCFVWSYWGRSFGEVYTQARAVKEVSEGQWSVVKGNLFFWSASFVRSMLTNAIVLSGVFGVDFVLSMPGFTLGFSNSLINLFARSWVDKWILDRQASTRKSGKVIQEGDQFNVRKSVVLTFTWNFFYGLLKNVALYGDVYAKTFYSAIGAIGVGKQFWEGRFTLKRKWSQFSLWFREPNTSTQETHMAAVIVPHSSLCEGVFALGF